MIDVDGDDCDLYPMILRAGTGCGIGRFVDLGYYKFFNRFNKEGLKCVLGI